MIGEGACARGDSSSIAIGYSASASSASSTALGTYASASGICSTALGYSASASGQGSTALGYKSSTCGFGALAIGNEAQATENEIVLKSTNASCTACNVLKVSSTGVLTLNGKEVGGLDISEGIVIGEDACAWCMSSNIAIGTNSSTIGYYSTAVGIWSCVSGDFSTALGHRACACGHSSTALGTCAYAEGNDSTALGRSAFASGDYSTALGNGACASGCGALAIGVCASAAENEIVLRSINSSFTACNVLKVSSSGDLIVNDKSAVATRLSSITDIDTTNNNYSLEDIATKLNAILKALRD